MNRRILLTIFLWLVVAVSPAHAATLPDMLGRPVAVPDGPLRLVSLAPSLTEIVFALGRGDWLVGVTEFCDYPPAARSKPRIGGTMTPNLERVVQVRPDLVLATAEGNPRDRVAHLERLGIPVFAVKPDGYAGVLASIRTLGRVLRAEAEAAALSQEMERRTATIRRAVGGRPRPRVLYLVWADPLIAAGPTTFIHDLIEMAGGDNVVRERAVPYPRLSWEEVLASAPEVILVATHAEGGDRPLNGGSWSAWQSIPAVRTGRIIALPGDTIHRPGPRVVEGLERLARAIHPEAFPPGGAR
ncbi:MAG: cobalamin-binding protein [candidate division NC10 bacterium]|nr:cobalamin-binding protein [candidate division NC10 bacterium]